MSDPSPFKARRDRLLARMAERGGGVAVVPTAPEVIRNRDTHYRYRHDSYFYYLTGFREPEALLLLVAGDEPRAILLCREKDPDREIWDGFRHGPDAARERFAMDETHAIDALDEVLASNLANQPAIYYALGHDATWDQRLTRALNSVRANSRGGVAAPPTIHDVRALLDEMRLIKDASEIALMRRAAAISAEAHRQAMRTARPGVFEYEVEAVVEQAFRRAGAQAPAYPSIVASGANACVLHYVDNDRRIADGDLLLIDAGCELDGYASDITRSFPVDGRFTGAQRDIYELVLAAQQAAVRETRAGAPWNAPHDAAVAILARGLIDLGLLRGSLDTVLENEDYRRFYMHRTGHWLGLDVHDAGEYKQGGEWRPLEVGMTLTIEPGCYVRPADDVPEAFWNIGVRIEDDALVTADGCELITAAAPKTVAEIEDWMAAGGDDA
ncbi:MAG: aminopeptidase P N-terminal domain-containing protein [Zoogloeaceae bacterium]|nr:aminopeptidase P N-terminal domain-containing protein [Rhodocyclaceae bacterium]MCP5235117.1 aminopeptidase P N-terminal domain-containing protein [Zoogloeaceae bacterium]